MVEQLITEHLDLWTSAHTTRSTSGRGSSNKLELTGIKKLRELILDLAVRGKLVSQDPSDEPTSSLLLRISEERKALVKQKIIRKPKLLPEIVENEHPFSLPQGWSWVRLNEIGDWGAGATPKRGTAKYYGGKIPWFKSGELASDFISTSEETVTEVALAETSLRLNKPGDVLIAMYGATIGKASILEVEGTTNQAVCACTPFSQVSNIYLLTLLKAYRPKFIGMGAGGAQPNISREKIIHTVIALPPEAEQLRIVAKVDELMALCDQLEQQTEASISAHQTLVETLLATLTDSADADELAQNWARLAEHFDILFTTENSIEKLKQTILQLAVMGKLVRQDKQDESASDLLNRIASLRDEFVKTKLIKRQQATVRSTGWNSLPKLPTAWMWTPLADLITTMDSGWSPACPPEPSPSDDQWGVLKTTAVQTMEYRQHENKLLADSKEPRPQYEVQPGDILITRAGPKNRVGISCLVRETRPKLMISDKIIRFHLVEAGMSERYISLCLNAGETARYIEDAKSGMAESQMNISQGELKAAPIPLCPTSEQHRIVAAVDLLFEKCNELGKRISESRSTQCQLAEAITQEVRA